jgi:hypothetical protein
MARGAGVWPILIGLGARGWFVEPVGFLGQVQVVDWFTDVGPIGDSVSV